MTSLRASSAPWPLVVTSLEASSAASEAGAKDALKIKSKLYESSAGAGKGKTNAKDKTKHKPKGGDAATKSYGDKQEARIQDLRKRIERLTVQVKLEDFRMSALEPSGPVQRPRLKSGVKRMLSEHSAANAVAPADFDFKRSTFDYYTVAPQDSGYSSATRYHSETSAFAASRRHLDPSYHSMYTVERQQLQDALVNEAVSDGTAHDHPWIVFTAGGMGAGKSHTIEWMSRQGYFPLPDLVKLDPDHFKNYFPEWQGYLAADQWAAGANTRKESGMLVEIGQDAAMRASKNIWVDSSLRDGEWFARVFDAIRARYPAYRIAILHVFASAPTVAERVLARGRVTGRYVPEAEVADSLRRVPLSVRDLTPKADFVAHIENETAPALLRTCVAEGGKGGGGGGGGGGAGGSGSGSGGGGGGGGAGGGGGNWHELQSRFQTLCVLNSPKRMGAISGLVRDLAAAEGVVVFSKSVCIFCTKLKARLRRLGVEYRDVVLDAGSEKERGVAMQLELSKLTNVHTVPQLFIGGRFYRHDTLSDVEVTSTSRYSSLSSDVGST